MTDETLPQFTAPIADPAPTSANVVTNLASAALGHAPANKMAPLFTSDKPSNVVEIPITADEIRTVTISDETHDKISKLRNQLTAEHERMGDDETENRAILYKMVTMGLSGLFDTQTAELIYDLSGREVMLYTEKYVAILEFVGAHFQSRLKRDVFSKYIPELTN